MSDLLFIQSRNNPRIKSLVALKESKHRKKRQLFLLEGLHEVSIAKQYGVSIRELYCENEVYEQEEKFIDQLVDRKDCFLISKQISEKISIRQNPAGIIAVCIQPELPDVESISNTDHPILILESIEKPGNLGAILRSAKAFGFDQIILCDSSIDAYHPNVVRNSRGHVLGMNIIRDKTENIKVWLENHGFTSFVASPESNEDLSEVKFPKKTALILGNEHNGVSDQWKSIATRKLKIAMHDSVDSLNVSVSASIVLYEVFKQLS